MQLNKNYSLDRRSKLLDAKMGWGDGLRDLVRHMTSGRYKGRHAGVMPDEESQGYSCNVVQKIV